MSGLAVSLQTGEQWRWDTAAAIALEVVDLLLAGPPRSVVNLNVPNRAREDVVGIRWARLAPFGEVRMALVGEDATPDVPGAPVRRLTTELQIADVTFDADTDTGLVREGYATITTLVGVAEAWPAADGEEDADGPLPSLDERLLPGAPVHAAHRLPDADALGSLHRPRVPR